MSSLQDLISVTPQPRPSGLGYIHFGPSGLILARSCLKWLLTNHDQKSFIVAGFAMIVLKGLKGQNMYSPGRSKTEAWVKPPKIES